MRKSHAYLAFAATLAITIPALAQTTAAPAPTAPATVPGAQDVSRIKAGIYTVDQWHTQVVWGVNHLGFNLLDGIFGNPTGKLTLDPAHPDKASVSLDFPIAKVLTTRPALTEHMLSAAILDATAFPMATFKSTGVVVTGMTAKISGNLTLHGVTKPIVLDARFMGAGVNPNSKKDTVGFLATTSFKRSDFGIKYAIPIVSDKVDLHITVAFERDS